MIKTLWIIVGSFLGFCVLEILPNHLFHRAYYSLGEISNFKPYDPIRKAEVKHAIVGNCLVSLNDVLVDYANNAKIVELHSAPYAYILNYMLKRASTENASFYTFGTGGTYAPEHLLYIYHALRTPNLKSVIWSNAAGFPAALITNRQGGVLETLNLLDKLDLEYPTAKPYVEKYRNYLLASPEFQKQEAEFGANWRQHIDPATLTLSKKRYFYKFENSQELRNSLLRMLFRGPLSLREFFLTRFSSYERDTDWSWDHQITEYMPIAKSMYGHPLDLNLPMGEYGNPEKNIFSGPEGEVRKAIFQIAASMVKAKGIPLIYYVPPIITITPKFYNEVFYPYYLDVVRKTLQPFGFNVIDHTLSKSINELDHIGRVMEDGTMSKVSGLPNLIGNFKRGRPLLEALHEHGLLGPLHFEQGEIERYLSDLPISPAKEKK